MRESLAGATSEAFSKLLGQIAVTLALANGTSIVTESIFENRFRYVDELTKMGATIQVDGRTAIISGVEGFTGADVHAPDLTVNPIAASGNQNNPHR